MPMRQFSVAEMLEVVRDECDHTKYGTSCRIRRCLIDAGYDPKKGSPDVQGVSDGTYVWRQMYDRLNKEDSHG